MDLFIICFVLSTIWVGPFWFSMLFKPHNKKTKQLMGKSLFFMGPIFIWFFVISFNPSGLVDFFNIGSHPGGFIKGIAQGMSTDAGVTAMWSHMVTGDIFVTRWIWKNCVKYNVNLWALRFSVFFGVMLMPIGVIIYLISSKK